MTLIKLQNSSIVCKLVAPLPHHRRRVTLIKVIVGLQAPKFGGRLDGADTSWEQLPPFRCTRSFFIILFLQNIHPLGLWKYFLMWNQNPDGWPRLQLFFLFVFFSFFCPLRTHFNSDVQCLTPDLMFLQPVNKLCVFFMLLVNSVSLLGVSLKLRLLCNLQSNLLRETV